MSNKTRHSYFVASNTNQLLHLLQKDEGASPDYEELLFYHEILISAKCTYWTIVKLLLWPAVLPAMEKFSISIPSCIPSFYTIFFHHKHVIQMGILFKVHFFHHDTESFETSLLVISETKSPKVTYTLWETKLCLKHLNSGKLYPSKTNTSGDNRLSLLRM